MTKVCKKCNIEKSIDSFYEINHPNGNKYRKSVCKTCFSENAKPYIAKWISKKETKLKINKRKRELAALPENKTKKQIQARNYLENNIEKVILSRTKKRAMQSNLPFNLTISDIIIPKICPILEIPLFIGTKESYKNSPSIDKIIPELGYVQGNIKIISMLANMMKNSADVDLLTKFSKNILNYLNNDEIV